MATIMFIHGAGCTTRHMEELASMFQDFGHNAKLVSLPGHRYGESPAGYSMRNYRDYVLEQFPNAGEVILVGHSMGGLIALMAAAKSKRVERVVTIGSVPPAGIPLRGKMLLRMLHPHYLRNVLFGKTFRFRDEDLRDLFLNRADAESARFFGEESSRAMRDILFQRCRISRNEVTCPVTVIGGLHDLLMPVSVQEAIVMKFDAGFATLDCGHMPMDEQGALDAVAEAIRKYVYTYALPGEKRLSA